VYAFYKKGNFNNLPICLSIFHAEMKVLVFLLTGNENIISVFQMFKKDE
jgi:hypothetical protein